MGFAQDLNTIIEAANLLKNMTLILFIGHGVCKAKLKKAKHLNLKVKF